MGTEVPRIRVRDFGALSCMQPANNTAAVDATEPPVTPPAQQPIFLCQSGNAQQNLYLAFVPNGSQLPMQGFVGSPTSQMIRLPVQPRLAPKQDTTTKPEIEYLGFQSPVGRDALVVKSTAKPNIVRTYQRLPAFPANRGEVRKKPILFRVKPKSPVKSQMQSKFTVETQVQQQPLINSPLQQQPLINFQLQQQPPINFQLQQQPPINFQFQQPPVHLQVQQRPPVTSQFQPKPAVDSRGNKRIIYFYSYGHILKKCQVRLERLKDEDFPVSPEPQPIPLKTKRRNRRDKVKRLVTKCSKCKTVNRPESLWINCKSRVAKCMACLTSIPGRQRSINAFVKDIKKTVLELSDCEDEEVSKILSNM